MKSKSYKEIDGISSEFVQEVVDLEGRPDRFLESAESAFLGLPDLDTHPDAKRVLDGLRVRLDALPVLVKGPKD